MCSCECLFNNNPVNRVPVIWATGHSAASYGMMTRRPKRWRPSVAKCALVCAIVIFAHIGTVSSKVSRIYRAVPDSGQANPQSSLVEQFRTGNSSIKLQHLVYNPPMGVLYVGGTNRLYELSAADLSVRTTVETGPRFESPQCYASGCSSEDRVTKTLTDNFNQILVLDPSVSALIVCGSVSQGACDKFRTANISLTPEFIPRAVAANDPQSSTFAFIGPEKYNPWSSSDVLYVGTTFTTVGDYRHDVPAVSTRNLYNLDYAEYSFSKQSLVRIDVKYRDHFLVDYVYGFNASDYAYFLTVQKKSPLQGQEEQGYITRLARTCVSDANYDSYTEITLECKGTRYNLARDAKLVKVGSDLAAALGISGEEYVLIITYATSLHHTSIPLSSSAVCLYTIRDIERIFSENIHMCFNGSMLYRNMEYISGPILDGKCPEAGTTGNIFTFCDVGLKISGIFPLNSEPALVYLNISITAIQTARSGAHTILFMGTAEGLLKKAFLTSPTTAYEFGEDSISTGHGILPDMPMDDTERHLFVLSTNKVTKYRVENCALYSDCMSCLQSKDPYCGWCSLEKKCTVQSACQKAMFSSPRWLSFSAGQQCIDFEMILPDRLPFGESATVQLTIRTLPALPVGAKYQCVWGTASPMDASLTGSGLVCQTPDVSLRPKIPSREDHVLVPLAVRSSETNKDFVSRNFAFYDCRRHRTCGSCVRSDWACSWCIYENLCTHNASSCGGTVVSGQNVRILQLLRENPAQLVTHGSGFCPRFYRGDTPLLAANAAKTELSLLVENLPHPRVGQLGFQCVVTIEGATMVVGARVETSSRRNGTRRSDGKLRLVVCEPTVYKYEAETGEYEARITLMWNRDHVVDSRSLVLYKCGVLGSHRGQHDCSLCVTRPKRYNCAWCGSTCRFAPTCPAFEPQLQALRDPTDVVLAQCPTPRIDVIQPLAGPLEGSTLVTIEGSNLGLKKEDVAGRVFIGDVPCDMIDYYVSVKIVCRTGPAPLDGRQGYEDFQYPVRVSTPAGATESTVKFTYTNVTVNDVWPRQGPASGGTVLSISGRYLNVGSEVSVTLDELPCVVNQTQSSSYRLVCTTGRATPLVGAMNLQSGGLSAPRAVRTLLVSVDGAKRFLESPFSYTPDPKVFELRPLVSPWSGGRLLTVHGAQLDVVVAPRIMVMYKDAILNSSACRIVNSAVMECLTPKVNPDVIEEASDDMPLDVGFLMDGVLSVRHLRVKLLYTVDPAIQPFSRGIKMYQGDTLVIEGQGISNAADESDVRVTVGKAHCNITSLTPSQIVCTPPNESPEPTDENGSETPDMLPLVVVHVGSYLRFPLGTLRYERPRRFPLTPEGIAGLAGGALFLVLISFVVLAVYRKKSSQAERVYKLMQLQMDSLESHVRTECKQAFAELQTDMTDLTADLESSGIPFLDRKVYIMRVFFPGLTDHPILNDPKNRTLGPRSNYDVAMLQFEQLIANKHFLLTLIDTLESQKSFNIRDKVNVASLLTVLLLSRMEYLTEVLRCLLLRLVASAASTKHPQLMLRRTESVVEKMLTNWLALCLYGYLKESAGSTLFLLYKAMKHQVEKGPVDAITHDARYSLAEEKLLREQLDFNFVTIHLLHDDPHYEKIPYQTTYSQTLAVYSEEYEEKVQVKVLDCDTISQVKAKVLDALYKNTPFSLRPLVQDVDLEWRHGRAGRVTLSDEDRTTVVQAGGWRQVNTLAHYGVRGSAVMALVPRQSDSFSSNCTGYYSYANSMSPLSSPSSEEAKTRGKSVRAFHLVRPAEDFSTLKDSRDRTYGTTRKAVPEIFLTRLLSTKGTMQQFVDDFFRVILSPNDGLPPAVKWLFDILDSASKSHCISEPEVIHAWKSNCLPLRFWVNFLKNPDFIFDISKTSTIEACLSVVSQTLIDSCSTIEHRLGKDSPSGKLLFAKDIPRYRTQIKNFYDDVTAAQPISDQELSQHMQQLSTEHVGAFDNLAALKELYIYVTKYHELIVEALDVEPHCRKLGLAHRLQSICYILESYGHSGPIAPMPPMQLSEL